MNRKMRLLLLNLLVPSLVACASYSTEQTQTPEILGTSIEGIIKMQSIAPCGIGILQAYGGYGVGPTFEEEFHVKRGCTNSIYWYEYDKKGVGKTFAWMDDLDKLNDHVRHVYESGKIQKLVTGPKVWPLQSAPPALVSYLDERYKPGAIPPSTAGLSQDADSVSGTVWDAIDSFNRTYVLRFNGDGSLEIDVASGTKKNASWKQSGATIFFESNDNYIERYGALDNGTMTGNTWNKTGARWTWSAKKRQ